MTNAFFSPNGGIEVRILSMIQSANNNILVAAYAFTNQKVATALETALMKGISVSIVMDKSQTTGTQGAIHDQLEKGGAQIRVASPPGGIMHSKFIVVDGIQLEWGSYNYTNRAEQNNNENATFVTDQILADQYRVNFNKIFAVATTEPIGVQRNFRRLARRIALLVKH